MAGTTPGKYADHRSHCQEDGDIQGPGNDQYSAVRKYDSRYNSVMLVGMGG